MSDDDGSVSAVDASPLPDGGSRSSPGDGGWTRDWRSWVLLGVLSLALLVVPWALILLPSVRDVVRIVGLSFRDAYLVVPLVPAIVLGVIGVWTAIRSTQR